MVSPLSRIQIDVISFGGELKIFWDLPMTLPSEYKVYVFKRSRTDITQEEIDSYFENIDDLSGFNYNGMMVFDRLTPGVSAISDMQVLNKETYHYKAVVRDEATGEYSETVGGSGMPQPSIKVNVKDGKEIVVKAIEKMLDSVITSTGQKVKLNKDIKIVKSFTIEPIYDNYIMVERVNGSNYLQFWGSIIQQSKNSGMYGSMDADVIRATFITTDTPERRDTIANIFRAYKPQLKRLCHAYGAENADVILEGDYYNPQIHGVNAVGFIVIFNLLIQPVLKVSKDVEVFWNEPVIQS